MVDRWAGGSLTSLSPGQSNTLVKTNFQDENFEFKDEFYSSCIGVCGACLCVRATQLLSKKCRNSGEPLATQANTMFNLTCRNLNLRPSPLETNALPLDQLPCSMIFLIFFYFHAKLTILELPVMALLRLTLVDAFDVDAEVGLDNPSGRQISKFGIKLDSSYFRISISFRRFFIVWFKARIFLLFLLLSWCNCAFKPTAKWRLSCHVLRNCPVLSPPSESLAVIAIKIKSWSYVFKFSANYTKHTYFVCCIS